MKKKILLAIAMIATLACLFAISVSAQDPVVTVGGTTYQFGDVITVDTVAVPEGIDTASRALMSDGKTYPAYYFVGARNSIYSNSFVWTNVTKDDGTAYSYADIIMLEIPSNVYEMANDAPLASMDNVVYVSVPSITTWKNEAHFSSLDSLVVLDLSRATKMTGMSRGFAMKNAKLTTVIWPTESSIKNIARGAFTGCTSLESIVIPNGVTSMGEDNHNNPGVFENCTSLKSVTLPDTLTFIGKKDYLNCAALTSIEIPSSVYKICREAFQNCSSLTTLSCRDVGEATAENLYIGHDNFAGCTALTSVTFLQDTVTVDQNAFKERSNTSFNIKALSGSIGNYAFYKCTLLNVEDMTGVTYIGQQAFLECKGLTNIKFGTGLTNISAEAFHSCTNIVFLDFGMGNNALEFPNHRSFYNCTSLKAVSLPAGTKGMGNGTFAGCGELEAFYMGESITFLQGNKSDGKGDGPCFADCYKLYFVQEPFSMVKEDGTFYTAEEFVMPKKPSVYFFPSTLKRLCSEGNRATTIVMDDKGMLVTRTGGSNIYDDLAFVNCHNLNSYLVLPEGFEGVDDLQLNDPTREDKIIGDTLNAGLFHKCGTAENPLTIVFMGKIDRLSFDKKNGNTNYLTYMLANPGNTSFENTMIACETGNKTYSNQDEMYVVFCHAAGGAQRYKVTFAGSEADDNYSVLVPTLVEGGSTHVANPNKNQIVTNATCLDNATAERICLCGFDMGVGQVDGSALGHNHTVDVGIVYENYMAKGNYCTKCERCDDLLKGDSVGAIFVDYGYSMTETEINGKLSMSQFFGINKENLTKYTASTGSAFEFGFVVSSNADPLNEANAGLIESGKTYVTTQDKFAHDYFVVTVSGFVTEGENVNTDKALTFCVYVKDGDSVSYLDNGETVKTVEMKSYNDVKALLQNSENNNEEVTE